MNSTGIKMPNYKVRSTGQIVNLTKTNFKAKGGEGEIFIQRDTVYKVCDPGKMIPEGKFKELAVLDHPKIVKPEEILLDGKNKPVGYTMRLVPRNARPLAQILTKAYRQRESVTPDMMTELVKQIADGIRSIHKKPGYLQVDGNELNYMVTDDHKDIYFIDVNSYQTPNYPADAIMPSIRDYHCPKGPNGLYLWSQVTDWYSFAIVSFFMFSGIHPFKGRHPNFTNLKTLMIDQMTACKSVLDPEVQFPTGAVYSPFEDYIPGGKDGSYMQWYRAIFCQNKRTPPPTDFQAILKIAAQIKEIIGSNNFDIHELRKFSKTILGYYYQNGREVVVTSDSVYVDNQFNQKPNQKFKVGFTPNNVPFAAWLENDRLHLFNLETKNVIPCDVMGSDIMSYGGRVYVQSTQNIFEIKFAEIGTQLLASIVSVASIMPNATELFQGVAIQDMFGARMISVFPQSGHHQMIKVDELSGIKVIDAKFERGVLMIVGMNGETGKYSRYVFRFAKDWTSYDLRTVENINPNGLNFTVLETGLCVCLTEDEKVEIFSSQKDSVNIKSISDPVIKSDMHLCHSGTQVRFAYGEKLFSIAVKK